LTAQALGDTFNIDNGFGLYPGDLLLVAEISATTARCARRPRGGQHHHPCHRRVDKNGSNQTAATAGPAARP
jgi:hypothetical protein